MFVHGAHCCIRSTWLQARASITAHNPLPHSKILDMESAGFHLEGTYVSRNANPLQRSACCILRTTVAWSL